MPALTAGFCDPGPQAAEAAAAAHAGPSHPLAGPEAAFCVYLSGPPARRPSQGVATLGSPRMAGAARQGNPGPGVHAPAGHPGASRCRRQSPRGGGGLAGNAAALSCLNRKRAPCAFPPAVIAAPRDPGGKLAFSGTTTRGMDFSFGISTFHFPGQRGQRAGRGALAIKPGASPRIGTEHRSPTAGTGTDRLGSPPCLSNCVPLTWSLGFSELLRLRGQHGRPIPPGLPCSSSEAQVENTQPRPACWT